MSLLNLFIKIHYNESKRLISLESLYTALEKLNLKAIQSLIKEKNSELPILHMPSTHDLLASIGEANCILTEINNKSSLEFEQLININNEYSTNLARGVNIYLKRSDKTNSISSIIKQFKLKMFESILKWDQIKNCLNLKTVKYL